MNSNNNNNGNNSNNNSNVNNNNNQIKKKKKKKSKKSYVNCPPIQLIIRDNLGWSLYTQNHRTGKLTQTSTKRACTDADIIFSADGKYFCALLENGIEIYDSYSGKFIIFLFHFRVRNVYFSPLNNYIISYNHRRNKDKYGNCWVWKWDHSISVNSNNDNNNPNDASANQANDSNPRVIYKFFLSEFNKKCVPLSFSSDEIIAARVTKNGSVLVYDVNNMHYISNNIIGKLNIANISSVVIAHDNNYNESSTNNKPISEYLLAIFAKTKNNKAATVTIYEYYYGYFLKNKNKKNNLKLFNKLCVQAFYNVDECDLLWDNYGNYNNNSSRSLLAIASSDVDTSGASYYGNKLLYLLSSGGNNIQIPISSSGKLQDVSWHPSNREFLIIDDHPQKTSIFNNRGNRITILCASTRNVIRFSSDGRFLWLGGFGNLTGEMSFYDYKNVSSYRVLGYNNDDSCRHYQWSPDSSTICTGRLYPYMTVDNGFKIYKYNGKLLYQQTVNRLYQIAYRPNKANIYPKRSPSPNSIRNSNTIKLKPKTKKRYVPPHLRTDKDKAKAKNKPKNKPSRNHQLPTVPITPPNINKNINNYNNNNINANYNQNNNQNVNYNNYNQNNQNYHNNYQSQYGYNNMHRQQNNNYLQQHQQQQQPSINNNNNTPSVNNIQQQLQHTNVTPANANNTNATANDNNNDNNNNNNPNPNKKKKRRKRNKNKNKNQQNNNNNNNNNSNFKPGLADNDNKRWARGSKFME